MDLLLATTNGAKVREYRRLLEGLDLRLVTPAEIGTPPDVEESGVTFRENALAKARAYGAWSGLPALADDGGITIDALDGEPGVRSRRWLGREASDDELIAHTLERLRGLPSSRRGAAMRVAVALVTPSGDAVVGEGEIRGTVPTEASPKRDPGFPFRSVFYLPEIGKYYLELSAEEHERVNHRRRALEPIQARLSR